jgi:GDP-4-dehydro-6-deoxy-D-mannose reductase
MKETTLVTGAHGFTGRHLTGFLRRCTEREIIEAGRDSGDAAGSFDLADRKNVHDLLARIRPSRIFHCAGSFTNAWESDFRANVESTRILLETVRLLELRCRVLLIGSAAEYGNAPEGPVAETAPLQPVSIYGMTKVMQTMLMEFFHRNFGMDIVMARTFNLFGTGCSPLLFPGRVAEQIERVRQGVQGKIQVRSLAPRRDYLHVNDAVRAYARIMEHGQTGEVYNVGSGTPVEMNDLMQDLLRESGLTMNDVESSLCDDAAITNVPVIYADIQKLSALADWEQTTVG